MLSKQNLHLVRDLTSEYFDMFNEMYREAGEIIEKTANNKRYLSKKEACGYLNISYSTLQSMIESGLPTVVFGRKKFIDIQDIHLFMKQHKI